MTSEYKPEWAKRLESWGKEMERKYGSGGSSRCCSGSSEETRTENLDSSCGQNDMGKAGWRKNSNPVGDLFGQLISYLVITYVPAYFPGFFQAGWAAVYTVFLYVILVHVAVDVVQIFIKARPIYFLGRIITNVASLVSMVVMVTIFPFNFPGNVGVIVQFGLWIAIAIVSIVTFFEFFKIFSIK